MLLIWLVHRTEEYRPVRKIRLQHLLTGTALGLALVFAQGAPAQTSVDNVPVPDTSQLPPLTLKDIAPTQAAPAPAAAPVEAAKPAEIKPVVETKPAEPVKPVVETRPVEPAKPVVEVKPEPVPAPAVDASAAPSADTLLAEKLREALTGKLDRIFQRSSERKAVEAFYKERDFAPLWVSDGKESVAGKAVASYLARADREGLEPSDYPVPDFKSADPAALADAELRMTASVLAYARHAATGRVAWSRVSADIYYNHPTPDAAEVLKKIAAASDAATALDGFQPQHAKYKALKKALADARAGKVAREEPKPEKKVAVVHIPEGKILRLGMKDERVIALRKRLEISGDRNSIVYDEEVRDAVKSFQVDSDLHADGNLGPNTTRALNGEQTGSVTPVKLGDPVETIVNNMDRWRWVQHDLGNIHVIVNIPDYRLTIYKDGKVYWTTRIVVGKPNLPTPLITADMKFITVNPTWNVPPSIIEKEYLPALEQDPMALERIGLKLEQGPDGTVRIWQPPGAGNALGRIRFNFPNKFLVYQHDTPDKHLFSKEKRAYSHGCMRVQDPLVYGEKLLSLVLPNERYTPAKLESMFGASEININFPNNKHIPVHITYQTAFVDADGKLQLREDVYGRDARMSAILKGERKVADIPVERPPNTSAKPVRMTPGMYGGGQYGGPRGGGDFFDWIFGGGPRGGAYYQQRGTYYTAPPQYDRRTIYR
jgi:murein L,D-transpeptidase YcbB/YkuD